MTLIVDAGTLFAQADADDPEHEAVVTLFEGERGRSSPRRWRSPRPTI